MAYGASSATSSLCNPTPFPSKTLDLPELTFTAAVSATASNILGDYAPSQKLKAEMAPSGTSQNPSEVTTGGPECQETQNKEEGTDPYTGNMVAYDFSHTFITKWYLCDT